MGFAFTVASRPPQGADPVMPATTPEVVKLPATIYLAVEGQGSPEEASFGAAADALYAVAYTLKAQMQLEEEDFSIGKLECLWWFDGQAKWEDVPVSEWHWKLLLRAPDGVDAQLVALVRNTLMNKRHLDAAADVRLETIEEGLCVEALHIGPYATEKETLTRMAAYMVEAKLIATGAHHEIYLSDPRSTPPEKLRTLLRQPVR